MTPRSRVLFALLAGVLVAGTGLTVEFWPRQISCPANQAGGAGLSNGGLPGVYNSTGGPYGDIQSFQVTPGATIQFDWSTQTGAPTTLTVLDGSARPLAVQTGDSGSGHVTAPDAEIQFAIPVGPPYAAVDVSWSCTETVEGP